MIIVEPGQAIALPRRRVQTICSVEHSLWLTQEGRVEDVLISGGGCLALHGRGRVVVQALSQRARFRVRYPETWLSRLHCRVRQLFGPACGNSGAQALS
jgi:hypothetical protein